jgi:type I restriction enzyme R subunit
MSKKEIELEFNGKEITYTEYKVITRKFIEKQIPTIENLQELWIDDSKRLKFIDMLQEIHIDFNFIKETEKSDKSDTFDVIANMVFESPLLTRDERAEQYIKAHSDEISQYGVEVKEVILAVLEKYRQGGIENINLRILLSENMLQMDAYNVLKSKLGIENVAKLFNDIKTDLYKLDVS